MPTSLRIYNQLLQNRLKQQNDIKTTIKMNKMASAINSMIVASDKLPFCWPCTIEAAKGNVNTEADNFIIEIGVTAFVSVDAL